MDVCANKEIAVKGFLGHLRDKSHINPIISQQAVVSLVE